MARILILLFLGTVINAALLPSHLDYPRGLERLLGTKREAANKKKERSLCETKECELIANVIKESMDESVDPCDDFYEYACGGWSNVNPRPENKTTWSVWDMVEEKVQKQIKAIIDDDPKPTDHFAVKLAKLWYKSCMDEEAAERRGVEPLLSTMWRFGGWPLIMEDGEWDDTIYTWQFVDDSYARLTAKNAFHNLHYGRLYFGSNKTITLDIPQLLPHIYGLLPDGSLYSSSDDSDEDNESGEGSQEKRSKEKRPKKGVDDEGDEEEENNEEDNEDNDEEEDSEEGERERLKRVEKYKEYVFNVSLVLSRERGVEVSHEKMKKDIADMVDFAIKLGELTVMESMEVDETTLDTFQELYDNLPSRTSNSKVNWKKKIHKLFEEAGITLEDDVELQLFYNYFKGLRSLLDETSRETIVNYVHWRFISDTASVITKEMEDLFRNWFGALDYDSREELCVRQVEMGNIVTYQFVEDHFSEEIAQTARDMIDDIQKEVEYQIKEATWMDEDTEHFILDKLVNMKSLIGYPEWYRNTTLVKRYFQGLTVGPSYYENILNYLKYTKLKELRQTTEREIDLELDPLMLDAFFIATENYIAITAADLQSPLFAHNRPWNINYGIIGSVMGHEVNHGFDNSGRLYDRKGMPMEWLSAMAAAYDKRALCFVEQFNKYSVVKGKNITFEGYGNRTAGENIADTMGLQAVFRAYQRRERECARPDPALPGLEKFSNEQTFFLSFANVWCESNEDPEYEMMHAKYDEHSSGRLRVIGSVSNSNDFAKTFNCPVGSQMNPEKKCNIWI